MLPMILNIIDNLVKISNMFFRRDRLYNKVVHLSKKEFLEFVLEFFDRKYGYSFNFCGEDVYLLHKNRNIWLYCDNDNCEILNVDDARKILGLSESKGISDIFIFTTKSLSDEAVGFFRSVENDYVVRYICKKDLDVNYTEFVNKFYVL